MGFFGGKLKKKIELFGYYLTKQVTVLSFHGLHNLKKLLGFLIYLEEEQSIFLFPIQMKNLSAVNCR